MRSLAVALLVVAAVAPAANAANPAIFEYPQTDRLITDDGQQFYDS